MNQDAELRNQLVRMLTFRQAHVDFEDAIKNFPEEHLNTRAPNCNYTFWHLLEHLRICQKDILDYIVADHYTEPRFPDEIWPDPDARTDLAGWQQTARAFLEDRQHLVRIVQDPARNLFAGLPNSGKDRHNILREINIVASHNAYHTGELVILRKMMRFWPG